MGYEISRIEPSGVYLIGLSLYPIRDDQLSLSCKNMVIPMKNLIFYL